LISGARRVSVRHGTVEVIAPGKGNIAGSR
jgi:hypothetical protein